MNVSVKYRDTNNGFKATAFNFCSCNLRVVPGWKRKCLFIPVHIAYKVKTYSRYNANSFPLHSVDVNLRRGFQTFNIFVN
jgi:hypothetical protein